jgi:hypothetical protein
MAFVFLCADWEIVEFVDGFFPVSTASSYLDNVALSQFFTCISSWKKNYFFEKYNFLKVHLRLIHGHIDSNGQFKGQEEHQCECVLKKIYLFIY